MATAVDWPKVEQAYFGALAGGINTFASQFRMDDDSLAEELKRQGLAHPQKMYDHVRQHRDDAFYGLFLDCDKDAAWILMHFNTEAALEAMVDEHTTPGAPYADQYVGLTREQAKERLRWDTGSWGPYFGIDLESGTEVASACEELKRALAKVNDPWETFMLVCSRLAIRLEQEDVCAVLKRTPDFRIRCAGYHEGVEHGEQRLQSVRESRPGA